MLVKAPLLRQNLLIKIGSFIGELVHRALILSQYAGCFIMWYGSITAAWVGLVPPGVTCWLTTGPWFLVYQENRLREAATRASNPVEFWRRTAMIAPVWMHLGFNAQVLVPIWGSVIFAGRQVSTHDLIGFGFCLGSMALIALITGLGDISWRTPWVLFLVALCTRVVEQGWVAFSGAANSLPSTLVYGLLIVTTQIWATTSLELLKMYRRRKESVDRRRAFSAMAWTAASALCNLASAVAILYQWA